MKEIKFDLIEAICEEQDFDELLLKILNCNKQKRINQILQDIEENNNFDAEIKKKLYEEIFGYVEDTNNYLKTNLKEIFTIAVKETIVKINNEIMEGKIKLSRKIKIIIADDNIHICRFIKEFLEKYEDIEILGIANSDEDEIKMIEELKPEIVITDLMRNHRYTGLDIIKSYFAKNKDVAFLVISADNKSDVINGGLEVAGYIKKPVNDYEEIYTELKRIKRELENKKYLEWDEKYHNLEILNIRKMLSFKEKRILKKLGITIKNKKHTECEIECLMLELLLYYDDPEEYLSKEEKKYQKSLEGTGVSREEYNKLLNKITKIKGDLKTLNLIDFLENSC